MADPVILKNMRDAYVSQAKPKRNFSNVSRLRLSAASGANNRVLLYWSKPQPLGSNTTLGKLRVWNDALWSGSVTMTVKRLVGNWAGSRVNWDNQPNTTTSNQVSLTKSNAAKNTMWEFDIEPMMQVIADGNAWYGVEIIITGTTVRQIYAAQAKESEFRPQVEIAWSDNPEPPENLIPDDNLAVSIAKPVLRYDYIDVSGGTTLTHHQVQLSGTEDFAVVTFDSGWTPTDGPEFDLANPFPNVITNGEFETDAAGWTAAGTGSPTVTRSTTQAFSGLASLALTATAAGSPSAAWGGTGVSGIPVVAGKTYSLEAQVRAATTGRLVDFRVDWYTAAGAVISTTDSADVSDVNTGWTEVSYSVVAPATAAFARVRINVTGAAIGETHYIDVVKMFEGPRYAGLANGGNVWWRVRTQDDVGLQSDWSEAAQFQRVTKGTLNVTALGGPNGAGNYYVEDTTPTILWALTGRDQESYKVIIEDMAKLTPRLFDSGQITSATENSVDVGPKKVLTSTTKRYRLRVLVWDTIDRVHTPGDPIYTEYSQEFVYQVDNSIDPPHSLTLDWVSPWPWMDLIFERTTPPDAFVIMRDDEVIEDNVDPADIWVSGTAYRYRDKLVSPRETHDWAVKAKVNGANSGKSNTATGKTTPGITWLMELDTENPIAIVKSAEKPTSAVDATSMSFQEVHQPIGGSAPVLITQYISGFEGHVDGVLASNVVTGLSGRTMRNRFKLWKRNPGTELLMYMVDEVMTVVPYNMTYRPRAKSGGEILYDVSFDFFQVDV